MKRAAVIFCVAFTVLLAVVLWPTASPPTRAQGIFPGPSPAAGVPTLLATHPMPVPEVPPERTPTPPPPQSADETSRAIRVSPDLSFETTVEALLALLPRLSPDEQVQAAMHIAACSDDTLAATWAQELHALPPAAAKVLRDDLTLREAVRRE